MSVNLSTLPAVPGGGSDRPEPNPEAEGCLFMLQGVLTLTIGDATHVLEPGAYAFIPPGARWTAHALGDEPARFHWIRKRYERVEGLGLPDPYR